MSKPPTEGTPEEMQRWLKSWADKLSILAQTDEYINLHACSSTLDGNFTAQELRHIADTMDGMFQDPNRIHFILKGQ